MAGAIIAPVLNVMGEALGVGPGAARLIVTTHGLVIALASPLMGLAVDRIGVRKPFILGLVLYGLAGAGGLVFTDYWPIIACRILLGIGVAAIYTAITVLILNFYEGANRNRVMGLRGSFNSIGGVIWPLLGGYLGTLSWQMPFAAYLIGIPLAAMAFFTIPESHRSEARSISASATGGDGTSVPGLFRDNPVLFLIYGLQFVMNVLLYVIVVFLPYLMAGFGITNTFHIGLFLSATTLSGGVASFMYGKIRARLSYRAITLTAIALWTAAFTTASQTNSPWVVGISVMLFGTGLGMLLPAIPVWAGELVPPSFRGRITSYVATFGYVGQFLSPVMLSPVAAAVGLETLYLGVGAACALFFVLFLALFRQKTA
jgi:MFS family permease